ncbi:MAG: peptidase S8, partial [Actinomyces oris]
VSYRFRLDTVGPVVSGVTYSGEGSETVVSFDVTDSSPLAGVDLHDPADGLWFYRHVFSDSEGDVGADGVYRYHVEIPFETISRSWTEQGGVGDVVAHPYVLAWDYGLNHSEAVTLDLPSDNQGACTRPDGGHWVKDGVGWWYQCADGRGYLANGWYSINGSDYLFGPSGYMATGWLKRADGQWVYADSDGVLVSGWVRDGSWYYLDPATKVMVTGWLNDRGTWYYLGGSGAMATGWVNDGGTWYYLDSSGAMRTGWLNQGGTWYYLGGSGAMATGWVNVGGSWYFLSGSGAMQTGTQTIEGTTYVFDTTGAWIP